MPFQKQESFRDMPMKKIAIMCLPVLLTGCSVYQQFVERMQTDTLEYQCDEKPLTVKVNNPREEVSFVYDNKLLTLKQGNLGLGRALYRRDLCFLVARRERHGL